MTNKRFGHFELLERIGSGGMADVFKARNATPGHSAQLLALKVMHPQFSGDKHWVEMFTSEAKLTGRLHHPNIVQVHDFGHVDHVYYLSMEYIDGHDLGWLIKRSLESQLKIPPAITAYIILELCLALSHAHRYRDGDGNVLVSEAGHVKLVDFGIAKAIHRSSDTTHGKLKGKYAYMAPEQLQGDPVDRRTDIFALGTVFFEALTGRALFQRKSIPATIKAVLDEPILPPSSVCSEVAPLDEIILKALARAPRDRYNSALELHAQLANSADNSCGIALPHEVAGWLRGLRAGRATIPPPVALASRVATLDAVPLQKPAPPQKPAPKSMMPTTDAVPLQKPALGTASFTDEAEQTEQMGQSTEHTQVTTPGLQGISTVANKRRVKREQEHEWTIDESEGFFAPSNDHRLDADPDALLRRLAPVEDPSLSDDFGEEGDEPTAVGLIDVEPLLSNRHQQVQVGHSAEIPAPRLDDNEEFYAFNEEDQPTCVSLERTTALLQDLKNLPSAEVVIPDSARQKERAVRNERARLASDLTQEEVGARVGANDLIGDLGDGLIPLETSDATAEKLAPPQADNNKSEEDLLSLIENESASFDEDAETVLNVQPPQGMGSAHAAAPFIHPTAAFTPTAPVEDQLPTTQYAPIESQPDFLTQSHTALWVVVILLLLASAGTVLFYLYS
ncbi:MAG: serine/threonine protein kinase [Deltaproteobacteria bacterium]|nr:serine/threonine protein kinase [Deltaproteobacteria bacterium]